MKNYKKLFLILVGILFTACIIAQPVLARAGGGESFGGGGGFSSGGFSGGGLSSGGFFFLPFIFGGGGGGFSWIIILIIFFFIVPYIIRRFGPQIATGGYRPYYQQPQQVYSDADLSTITADDPYFNKQRFIDMVQTVFFEIQNAWMKKSLGTVRGYMTDAQFQRFQVQLDDFTRRGVTNVLEQIAVGKIQLIKATRDENYETITCAIHASMIDYKINDESKKVVDGNPNVPNEFTEYWTFMRSSKVKTKTTDSLVTKTCPNCGAPLDINEAGQCKYCNAYVISGDFDWILTDISQDIS